MCDWGAPSEVTRASTRLGSRVAVSAGARSIAVSTKGSSTSGAPGRLLAAQLGDEAGVHIAHVGGALGA